jgi:hypothetical protein
MCDAQPFSGRTAGTAPTGAPRRRGAIAVFAAALMVAMLAMVAFSVDVGYIATAQTELQRSVDAGALAGAGVLAYGADTATNAARSYLQQNHVAKRQVENSDIEIDVGHWDETARSFAPSTEVPSAIRVRAQRNDERLFFAPVIGSNVFDISAEAIAMYRPRDIVLVLDYSASMNDDSEFMHISSIGQPAVEANLLEIYNELGAPTFGNMQWTPVYNSSSNNLVVKQALGLANAAGNTVVPYPYPQGSWDEYINYVRTSSYIYNAGYRRRYGYLTLMNYILEKRPMVSESPDLWQTSEQPITALKNAVTVFLSYLQEVDTDDRLGLAVYTAADGTAVVESSLTSDFQSIEDISRQRQAGHYDRFTNIGAGLQKAHEELTNNARPGAFKLIILMTDGLPNRPTNEATGTQFALDQAELCAQKHYPVVTISLGAGADAALMQQIADMTAGVHFNVPGGRPIAEVEEDLKEVFRKVADDRPLKLVQ